MSSANRKLPDFLTAYLEYVEDTEPAKAYHVWSAVSLLAGTLERRVYLRWGHETLYPNMYIVLVGPSGNRKSTALNIAKDLLKEINVKVVPDAITQEKLIRKMKESTRNFNDATSGVIKFQSSMTCFSPEFSVFLGKNDTHFLGVLTDWYDSADDWEYETKNKGEDHIQGVCFNLLGATAPDWFQAVLPPEAIGGGFTSRIIFVVEQRKGKIIKRPPPLDTDLRGLLVNDLQVISTLSGQVTWTDDAAEFYANWYVNQEHDSEKGIKAIDDTRFYGYCDRRATHLRKLGLLMSVSRCNTLEIDVPDLERALELITKAELTMPQAFGGYGKSQYAEATESVLEFIMVNGEVTRSSLLRKFRRDVDSQTLKVVEEVLEQMKVVQIRRNPQEGEVTYVYTGPQ